MSTSFLQKIYHFFTSLKLTVILLAFSMLLIFFGTLDQVEFGIYEVQKRYFASFFAHWQYPYHWLAGSSLQWLKIPLLGGYTLGVFLALNLLFAHFKYFQKSWKKLGIIWIHSGLLLLILSGFITGLYQEESQMWLNVGQTLSFSQNHQENECVLIDTTSPSTDTVYSIDASTLQSSKTIHAPTLPFTLQVLQFFPNSEIGLRSQNPDGPPTLADQGAAIKMGLVVWPKPITYKSNEINTASAYVRLLDSQGQPLGTWLLSNLFDERFPPQTFTHQGHHYQIALRFKRTYFPFALELLSFTHERYPGTEIPKNFASLVRILPVQPDPTLPRQALIYMNHPLRFHGFTFYQASFGNNDTASMLQVVRNPGRLLPYLSLLLIGLGLLFQFTLTLVSRLYSKNSQTQPVS